MLLPNKKYRSRSRWIPSNPNHDLDLEKFFVKAQGDWIEFYRRPRFQDHQLNREIYFRPSYSPLISIQDQYQGSCFQDLEIPTGSWRFKQDKDLIATEVLSKNLALDEFTQQIHLDIRSSVDSIYHKHPKVTLCLSGGIDSLVLLSYIISADLLSRTNIAIFENHTQVDSSCLHQNPDKKLALSSLLDDIGAKDIDRHVITNDDIAWAFNQGTLADIKCYATSKLLRHYKNQALLFGQHGNQVLIHKPVFLDEIVIRDPSKSLVIDSLQAKRVPVYTQSCLDYVISDTPVGIERRHFLVKPWSRLNGVNGNLIYSPIGSDHNFTLVRQVDFSTVDPMTVFDAQVARAIIHRNVGSRFDPYIITESVRENDNLETIRIPNHLVEMEKLLSIPQELNHDPEGIEYIRHEISKVVSGQDLAINTAVSIKSLQYIQETYK